MFRAVALKRETLQPGNGDRLRGNLTQPANRARVERSSKEKTRTDNKKQASDRKIIHDEKGTPKVERNPASANANDAGAQMKGASIVTVNAQS